MSDAFNLSAWALANRTLVGFLMVLIVVSGTVAYSRLGQSEDPPFTFKIMVVRTLWPGATATEIAEQVSDRIEKAVLQTGQTQYVRSYSRNGESVVQLMAKDAMSTRDLPALWYQIRKRIGDIKPTLPQGVQGPFFNDEFGDTYGNIYALTSQGFERRLTNNYADRIETAFSRLTDVAKITIVGLQEEVVWVEIANTKMLGSGLTYETVRRALAEQNSVLPAGYSESESDRIAIRIDGSFTSLEDIRKAPLRIDGKSLTLGDIATVHRGLDDPPAPRMRLNGNEAIGIAVSMKRGGDIIRFGRALDEAVEQLNEQFPVGITLSKVADQPLAVRTSINEFVRTLAEAIIIVLAVSFFALGRRPGTVVAISIPLVLAMTFVCMYLTDIGLHKISLGALILALGLLVDDAIIAVEMMAVKIEEGLSRLQAATHMYRTSAFPMLTGTLVTSAGFLPIATAASTTGEYTRSIFQVVVIALIASWLVAVVFIPVLGNQILSHDSPDKQLAARPYRGKFYQSVRRSVRWCVDRYWLVIALTLAIFAISLYAFHYVPRQFFPSSTRLELMVDLELAEGASTRATASLVSRFEADLNSVEGLKNYVCYVGSGSPRFYLPLDQKLPSTNFAECVLNPVSLAQREQIRSQLQALFAERYGDVQARVQRLENGPPVGFPIQFRVSGEHLDLVQKWAHEVLSVVRQNPFVRNAQLDWSEPSQSIHLVVDQERAQALGVSSASLAKFLNGVLTGVPLTTLREGKELIDVRLRGPAGERDRFSMLGSLVVPTSHGGTVSVDQIATLANEYEPGVVWRRNRLPTVTIRADLVDGATPKSVTTAIEADLIDVRVRMPFGYLLETGGTVEDSERGSRSVAVGIPLFLMVLASLLMVQLKSISRVAMVLLTAPLGFIGVVWFLLIPQVPFGFVAMLGTIALSGMIMRNSVILVVQIDNDIAEGVPPYTAVIEATVRRFRPIVLTAFAAVLAMIPLSRSVFFGPMAIAIMGGLIVATALTLLFLPALYASWFKIKFQPHAQGDLQ